MKAINSLMIAAWVGIGLSACSGLRLSDTNALADDVYYDGSGGGVAATAPAVSTSVSASDVSSYERRVAQYAGSRTSTAYDNRDYSQIQQYYANASSTNGAQDTSYVIPSTVKVTEVSSEYPDNGYWVDGFNGSESDQSYAERIIKFHRPLVSVNYYSPFFESARWSGDWNIYVDGYGSTYMVPTWSNPWYSDYYYGGLAYDWRWGRGWGFGLGWNWGSWNWGIGWSTGWGYYDWAYGGWGWPYYHHHHYFGHPYRPHHGGLFGPGHDDKPHHDSNRDDRRYEPVRASRAVTTNQTYSGTRQRELTTNPRGEAAGQRYRQTYSGSERSYTRTTDGRATTTSSSRVSSSYGTNSRTRSDAAVGNSENERAQRAASAYQSNSRTSGNGAAVNNGGDNAQRTSSAYQTNSRRTTTATESNQTSRSTYTPNSRTTTRTQQAQQGVQRSQQNRGGSQYNTNTRRSSSSSTYTPSRSNNNSSRYNAGSSSRSSNRQSTTSGSSSRPRQSMSSQRSSGSSRSGSSFSGGGRSSGGGHSSGGSRGGGRSR